MAGGGCLWTSPISEMVAQSKGWDDDLEKDCDDDAENGVVVFCGCLLMTGIVICLGTWVVPLGTQ